MYICRFCLKLSSEDSCKNISTIDDEKFKLILPEIVLSSIEAPIVCKACSKSLDDSYAFKTCCLQTEKHINDYREVHGNVDLIEIRNRYYPVNDNLDEKGVLIIDDLPVKAEVIENNLYESSIDNSDDGFNASAGEEDLNMVIKSEHLNNRSKSKIKSYKCLKCTASFMNSYGLRRHQSAHIIEKKFSCTECGQKFATSRYLNDHAKRHHAVETKLHKFECKFCGKRFVQSFKLKRHYEEVHSEKKFKCTNCSFSFTADRYLQAHIARRHRTNENNSEEVKCEQCMLTFSSQKYLQVHIDNGHKDTKGISPEKYYKCDQCAIRFSASRFLLAHINRKHKLNKELKFTCLHCNISFTTLQCLQTHTKEQHDNLCCTCQNGNCTCKQVIFCKFCAKQFENSSKLRDHETECLEKQFVCDICGKRYSRKSNLQVHINQTHSTQNHELICQTCGSIYKNKMSLKIHIQTQHLGIPRIRKKYHKCEVCNKSFCKPTGLRRHKLIHEVHTDFVCPICQQGFNSKFFMHEHFSKAHYEKRELTKYICQHCDAEYDTQGDLNAHKAQVHTKYRCTCEICGISCCKKSELAVHMRIHTGIKPFACDECGKAFVQYSTLLIHKRSVHSTERPFSCTYCEKSFALKGSLSKHIEGVHLKDKLEKKFQCTFCSKSFLTRSGLRSHTAWHTGERKYICEICSKCFVNSSSLRKHMLIHSDEKQHECLICSKRFHQKSNLKIHMKVHNKTTQNVVLQN